MLPLRSGATQRSKQNAVEIGSSIWLIPEVAPPVPEIETKFLQLSGGGVLAYSEYGEPDGVPVLFCHGWQASRVQAAGAAGAAGELGIRLIAPDRPGIGLSTFQAGRELSDWPPLVEALANALTLGDFAVAGLSGGGPYALATAWALRDRVRAAAVVSGAPPIAGTGVISRMPKLHRVLYQVYSTHPELARAYFHVARPLAMNRFRAPGFLRRAFAHLGYREAWRQSAEGVALDAEIYVKEWQFRVSEIEAPVYLWHGSEDRTFPARLINGLAAEIPNCKSRILHGECHFSAARSYWPEILRELIDGNNQ